MRQRATRSTSQFLLMCVRGCDDGLLVGLFPAQEERNKKDRRGKAESMVLRSGRHKEQNHQRRI